MILSEQGPWRGQNHPSYGVTPQDRGLGLVFLPWCYDGTRVIWGHAYETHSEAMVHARQLAGHS
jgi:hypothetical protein